MPVTATRWMEAEAKLKYNLTSISSSSATAISAGELAGADIFRSFALPDGRIGFTLGDWFVPSAAGQNRGAVASANGLVHNGLVIASSADLENATMTSYHGSPDDSAGDPNDDTTVLPFMRHAQVQGSTYWSYGFGGMPLPSGRLLLIGTYSRSKTDDPNNLGTSMCANQPIIYDDVSGNAPTSWVPRHLQFAMPHESFHQNNPVYWSPSNPIDGGDGYAYMVMQGPSRSDIMTIARFDIAQADDSSKWIHLEWLAPGGRWTRDVAKSGAFPYSPAGHARSIGTHRERRQSIGFGINGTDQLGGIHLRPDGKWQLTMIPDFFPVRSGEVAPADPHVRVAVVDDIRDPFSTMVDVYDIPVGTQRFYYGAYSMPEVTWAGKGTNDQAILYSHNMQNAGVLFNDAREYWMEILKVTGIP